ncbi:MAG: hypothetical protein ABSF77_01320 [Spirochaetia bacterium]|jgi:hypothetical protein
MFLFLIASLPLLFSLVVLLPWDRGQAPRPLALVSTFLKGVLLFFPGYLAILIVRRIFGFSYNGFLLYLSLLLRDHLAPLLAALGGFLLLQRTLSFSGTDEGIFLTAFACLSGFLSMVNITDSLRAWGSWDGYVLFLLPVLRIASALVMALAAQRFFRWEGRDGWLFCAACAACALLFALASYFDVINRLGWAIPLAVLPVLGAVAVFAMRFPRAVRG